MATANIAQRRKQLLDELKIIDQEEENVNKEYVKTKVEAWSKIEHQYEWKCEKIVIRSTDNGQINGIIVSRRIKPNLFLEFEQKWGSLYDNCWRGTTFYRTDENILTSNNGSPILNIPKLCTDQEWNLIVSGKIPEKFIRH